MNNKVYNTGGQKDLKDKLPVHLVTGHMINGIALGFQMGMDKGYEKHNWQLGLPIVEGHLGAALRHIFRYIGGEDTNTEMSKDGNIIQSHHLDNALTHIAMAVHQVKEGRIDLDDRFKKDERLPFSEDTKEKLSIGLKQVKEGNTRFKHSHDWGCI